MEGDNELVERSYIHINACTTYLLLKMWDWKDRILKHSNVTDRNSMPNAPEDAHLDTHWMLVLRTVDYITCNIWRFSERQNHTDTENKIIRTPSKVECTISHRVLSNTSTTADAVVLCGRSKEIGHTATSTRIKRRQWTRKYSLISMCLFNAE